MHILWVLWSNDVSAISQRILHDPRKYNSYFVKGDDYQPPWPSVAKWGHTRLFYRVVKCQRRRFMLKNTQRCLGGVQSLTTDYYSQFHGNDSWSITSCTNYHIRCTRVPQGKKIRGKYLTIEEELIFINFFGIITGSLVSYFLSGNLWNLYECEIQCTIMCFFSYCWSGYSSSKFFF